jgi:YVTN family beta-propeller protein
MLGDIILGYKAGARRLAAVGVILTAGVSLSACGGAAKAAGTPTASPPASAPEVGGYEGWWNATPASGSTAGLPQEAVAVNTRTNKVVDAFSRRINDAGRATLITDVPYTVVPDPSWPADSVVIIDTATNKVIEDFRVDLNGNPLR